MIPQEVDIADLSAQLRSDGVAFSNDQLAADAQLQSAISGKLNAGEGLAVVEVVPQKSADLRDVAQELADAADLDTVIVQAPTGVSIVSSNYSRAAIESVQAEIPHGTNQVALVEQIHAELDSFTPPVLPMTMIAGALFLAAVYFSFQRGVKTLQRS